jgi:hypothetical protein
MVRKTVVRRVVRQLQLLCADKRFYLVGQMHDLSDKHDLASGSILIERRRTPEITMCAPRAQQGSVSPP